MATFFESMEVQTPVDASSIAPLNLSRRRFSVKPGGATAGSLVLGFCLPVTSARAQAKDAATVRGTKVQAFLEICPDNSVRFLSPFIEGGQCTFTAMPQIVGEELDADRATSIVESAHPGPEYVVMSKGQRFTGGSMSVRLTLINMTPLSRAPGC
jgi:isoquinoline 1-oxidoreductase subunit beta